jgi:hypothetical protein
MKRILVCAALLIGLASLLPQAMTAPEPYEVPTTWELKFESQTPMPITVMLPGKKTPTTFWYMLYTVTNMTRDPDTRLGADQDFIPEFVLYTDTGKASMANRRLPHGVYNAIKKRHNNPLLKGHTDIMGKILYGRDNAKDGVAIWPDIGYKTSKIDVFVGGLSGETAELKLPKPVTVKEADANGIVTEVKKDKVILHKSLRLGFTIKGQTGTTAYSRAKPAGKKWVLR